MKILNLLILALFCALTTSGQALDLSINKIRFMPDDVLRLTLMYPRIDRDVLADIYVAVSLPADGRLYFFAPQDQDIPVSSYPRDTSSYVLTRQDVTSDVLPFVKSVPLEGKGTVISFKWSLGTPVGKYTFYAVAVEENTFFAFLSDVVTLSFFYADQEPAEIAFIEDFRYPDGTVGRAYSQSLELLTGIAPFSFRLAAGALPEGLLLDDHSGLIQGTPTAGGVNEFTVQAIDSQGNQADMEGVIKVRPLALNVGEHGAFKGCNGLQTALDAVQDLDEIRIEQGTYGCTGLELASDKTLKHGIRISGGWDAAFEQQTVDPALTVFDAKFIEGISSETDCTAADAANSWKNGGCYRQTVAPGSRIFTSNAHGPVAVEVLNFRNNIGGPRGGAVYFHSSGSISNSDFSGNSTFKDETVSSFPDESSTRKRKFPYPPDGVTNEVCPQTSFVTPRNATRRGAGYFRSPVLVLRPISSAPYYGNLVSSNTNFLC
ncbi:MAG: hypothetical protein GY862_13195 [Gammaproteobacteria bacterium]|nr:hypothetical protein [Gammaproteobacteria bacterium]